MVGLKKHEDRRHDEEVHRGLGVGPRRVPIEDDSGNNQRDELEPQSPPCDPEIVDAVGGSEVLTEFVRKYQVHYFQTYSPACS